MDTMVCTTLPQDHTPTEWHWMAITWNSPRWPVRITDGTTVRFLETRCLGKPTCRWQSWVRILLLIVAHFSFRPFNSKLCLVFLDCLSKPAENWALCPTVAPSPPLCRVPSSVTTGTQVVLTCFDRDASPPPTYSWYKNAVLLPSNPSTSAAFKNTTYTLNAQKGTLVSDHSLLYITVTDSCGNKRF